MLFCCIFVFFIRADLLQLYLYAVPERRPPFRVLYSILLMSF